MMPHKKILDFLCIFSSFSPGFFMNIINRKQRTDNENINHKKSKKNKHATIPIP